MGISYGNSFCQQKIFLAHRGCLPGYNVYLRNDPDADQFVPPPFSQSGLMAFYTGNDLWVDSRRAPIAEASQDVLRRP